MWCHNRETGGYWFCVLRSRKIHHVDEKLYSENYPNWWNRLQETTGNYLAFQLGRIEKNDKGKKWFLRPRKSTVGVYSHSPCIFWFINFISWNVPIVQFSYFFFVLRGAKLQGNFLKLFKKIFDFWPFLSLVILTTEKINKNEGFYYNVITYTLFTTGLLAIRVYPLNVSIEFCQLEKVVRNNNSL